MAYATCPMFGGTFGYGGYFLNWVIIAAIFAAAFWCGYYFFVKNKLQNIQKRKGR